MSNDIELTEESVKYFIALQDAIYERAKIILPVYYESKNWPLLAKPEDFFYDGIDRNLVYFQHEDVYNDRTTTTVPLNLIWDEKAREEVYAEAERRRSVKLAKRLEHEATMRSQKEAKERAQLADLIAKYGVPK